MGGEQSAFRSLVPSASTAAIAFLTRLREHQIQQQVLHEEHQLRKNCSSSYSEEGEKEEMRSQRKEIEMCDKNGNRYNELK